MLYATDFTAAAQVTATAADVLKGKLFVTSSGVLTEGTMGSADPGPSSESSSTSMLTASSFTLFGRTTAEPQDVRSGKLFVDRTGTLQTGTYGGASVTIYCDDVQDPPVIYYRTVKNGVYGLWTLYIFGTALDAATQRVEFKGTHWGNYENPCHFVTTGRVNSGGDLRSLTGSSVKNLKNLFKDCEGLLSAPDMPYEELSPGCFHGIFRNTGIYESPYLPAASLVPNCYDYMFYDCRNLHKVTVGFTDWGDDSSSTAYATNQWLCGNVPATGIFEAPPALPARTGDCSYIPWNYEV